MNTLKQTPLTQAHKALKAKTGPFAGFEMPIQYDSILAEHQWTREKAGIFDICHMGEFFLSGPGAAKALDLCVTHDVAGLAVGACRYGFLLNDSGGIIDDLIVYRLEDDAFMLVVNGARVEADFSRLASLLPEGLDFEDRSDETAKIDVQGPLSLDVLESVMGKSYRHLKYFRFEAGEFENEAVAVSRTGYTGELGYEIYLPAGKAEALWNALLADERVKPVGLGARDTLRLEAGLPLYGQDLDENHTPTEAGFDWLLKSAVEYAGKAGQDRVKEKLVGLAIDGRRSARHDDVVLNAAGESTGRVTSGSFAPTLGHCLALAYVKPEDAQAETLAIQAKRTTLEAKIAKLPFYTGTARKKLD